MYINHAEDRLHHRDSRLVNTAENHDWKAFLMQNETDQTSLKIQRNFILVVRKQSTGVSRTTHSTTNGRD